MRLVAFMCSAALLAPGVAAQQLEKAATKPKGLAFKDEHGIGWNRVSGGSAKLGSKHRKDEQPVHDVDMASFYMTKFEITIGQWKTCMAAGACKAPTECDKGKSNWAREGKDDHPVTCVNWHEAKAFADWVGSGARLCSEHEWEWAARSGGRQQRFPWGDKTPTCEGVNYQNCKHGTMRTIARGNNMTRHGVSDLAGNVWEWTEDVFHPTYDGAPSDEQARTKPEGPKRVIRGGGWNSKIEHLRAARRFGLEPDARWSDLGVRLCMRTERQASEKAHERKQRYLRSMPGMLETAHSLLAEFRKAKVPERTAAVLTHACMASRKTEDEALGLYSAAKRMKVS